MSVGKIAAFGAILCSTVWAQCVFAQDTPPLAPPPPGAAALPPEAAAPPPGAGAPPPAVAETNVNLRQGPGTTYAVVTLIPAGSPVNVSGCNGGWCQVNYEGQNGYIIATAIAPPGSAPPRIAGGPPEAPPPSYLPPPPPPYYYGGYYGGPYYGPYGRGGYYGHRRW
jgi:hypothetical protein